MKKVCVVSNVIGNRDVIHNGDNGYVCDTTNEFIAAIKERKDEYAEKAYYTIIENYETKIQAKKYADIYKSKL